ncbi:Oidioi.mRNA.OKI2018_I69.chr2.g8086.t1.cds [Oikopleura dioica]|uniref:Oidioi.mRNA.OKI2018_I69.chr2.g8086.t1.cds n=1 Tax=Oikopleura dioica TaxID=34765 RepID=A0ABN7TBK6_OIKDI|nr:Oidioi.mRNA.OKI2018_I69.chr2.g8086.t1.cds [Oikopleura dioica]
MESSSEEEIQFWILQDDCKTFKNASDDFPPIVFEQFGFFLNELSPIAFSRANIALERTALSVSKRISWMIKEVLPLTTTKNMVILSNSLRLVIKKLEELSKILPSWIRDVHDQLKSSLSLVDAYLQKSCLSSILMIFNCQESLDIEFPKRPMERDSATPMIQASKYYMLKPERVILERVVYYLRKANTPKNQEVVLLLEQLGRSSCSLDSAVLDAYCDLTVECTESYDLVFDTNEEDSPSPSNLLNASLPLEIPELEEPLWKNMSKLSFSKADFKSFIALRHSS